MMMGAQTDRTTTKLHKLAVLVQGSAITYVMIPAVYSIPPSVPTDTQGSPSAQVDAMVECYVPITSSNSTPPVLPAMLNPSLQPPARKRPSMTMCGTTDLSNDNNDLKCRHMEFDDVYPVGETSVTAQGTHTYHGNDSAKYPSKSVESVHEPAPSLPPPTPRSLTKKEQQRSRSHSP